MNQRASFIDDETSTENASKDNELDLSGFGVKTSSDPHTLAAGKAVAAHVAENNQFMSRQAQKSTDVPVTTTSLVPAPAMARYTTGRNQQLNMKAKGDTIEKLKRLAGEASERESRSIPQAEILERALQAYERELNSAG